MLKPIKIKRKYESYRWFFTSNDVLVVGGKSDEQNEIVLKKFLKKDYTVLHTSKPGSPFMIIQKNNPDKQDMEEAAVFCGAFSQQWKKTGKIKIDIFKANQIYKTRLMKKGTFGVKGGKQTIEVKPELVLVFQKSMLRAIPKSTYNNLKKEGKSIEALLEIQQGKLNKEGAAEKIAKKIKEKFNYPISKQEVMQAIPSDKLSIK